MLIRVAISERFMPHLVFIMNGGDVYTVTIVIVSMSVVVLSADPA
jgi:hypothetical protein